MSHKKINEPPEISPYLFPIILAAIGVWCFYDGFITTDVEMQKHQLFNRVAAGILIPWSIVDFIRTRRKEKEYALKKNLTEDNKETPEASDKND